MNSARLPRPVPALRLVAGLAAGCAVALGAASPVGAQTELPKSSPFMSATAPEAASAPTETIEFAAVRTIGQRTEIDLYDTQGKKNHWIPLGGTADGMTVMSYDAHRDQVIAKIGGVNKVLLLRRPRGAGNSGVVSASQPAMSFSTPEPSLIQKVQPPAPDISPAPAPVAGTPVPAAAPAAAPAQPAAPLSVARQEEEARMLVSDLLEIGMAQRKAYEEKQKKAADPSAAATTTETPAPAQKPDGTPDGG